MSQRWNATSSKPAFNRMSLVVSASAIENGPGPQVGSSVSSGFCDERLHRELGPVQPVVVELSPPHHHAEPATGNERLSDVPQRGHGVGEEHRPHAREREVVGVLEFGHLDIGGDELDVRDAGLVRLRHGGLDEALSDVDADRLAFGSDYLGQALRRIAEPAADVEHALAARGLVEAKRRLAVDTEPARDDFAMFDEPVEQRPVSGLDRLVVLDPGLLCAHAAPAAPASTAASGAGATPRMRSAARSATAIVEAFVLPRGTLGMTDASTTRRPSTPRTRSSGSTMASSRAPIAHVPTGW